MLFNESYCLGLVDQCDFHQFFHQFFVDLRTFDLNGLVFLFFFMSQSIVFCGQHLCLIFYLDERMHRVVLIPSLFTILTDIVVTYSAFVSNSFNLLNFARFTSYSVVNGSLFVMSWLFQGLIEVFQIDINSFLGFCFELLNFSMYLPFQLILVLLQLFVFFLAAPVMLKFSLKIECVLLSLLKFQFVLFDLLAFVEIKEFPRICNIYLFIVLMVLVEEPIANSRQKLEISCQLLAKLFIVTCCGQHFVVVLKIHLYRHLHTKNLYYEISIRLHFQHNCLQKYNVQSQKKNPESLLKNDVYPNRFIQVIEEGVVLLQIDQTIILCCHLSQEQTVIVYPWQDFDFVQVSPLEQPQYVCSQDDELLQLLQCAWKATDTQALDPKAQPSLLE